MMTTRDKIWIKPINNLRSWLYFVSSKCADVSTILWIFCYFKGNGAFYLWRWWYWHHRWRFVVSNCVISAWWDTSTVILPLPVQATNDADDNYDNDTRNTRDDAQNNGWNCLHLEANKWHKLVASHKIIKSQ